MPSKVRPGRRHIRAAYRSGLEAAVAAALTLAGVTFAYEAHKVPFTQPEKQRTYTPDFILPNGIIVETKGLWDTDDRAKHELIQKQHPDLDIRMVFSSPTAKIGKGSKTTYAMVCQKRGIKYAHKSIPPEWLREGPNERSITALKALGWSA